MTELYNVYGVIKQIVFATIRTIYLLVRWFLWHLDGSWQSYEQYERSAHVERILWRAKKSVFESIQPHHFLTKHESFKHPDFVLRDDVILTQVNQQQAFFLQMKHPLWHYTADKVPFCWITLFDEALNIVTMPTESMHKLADNLGPIKTPSMIISNQGRCGSTLLVKLMHMCNAKVVALSEPDALANLQDLIINKEKMGKDFYRIMKSSTRLIFKPVKGADAIVIKVRLTAMRVIKYVGAACPELKHIYMQRRDSLKTVQSWQKAFISVGRGKLLTFLGKYHLLNFVLPHFFNFSDESTYVYHQGCKILNLSNPFETLVIPWADSVSAYMACSETVLFHVVVYEDLLSKPRDELLAIFNLLGIEASDLDVAIKNGFKGDSQEGTPLSTAITSTRQAVDYTDDIKKRVDAYLDSIGIPRLV